VTRTLFSTHLSSEAIRQFLPVLVRRAMWRSLVPIDVLERLPTRGNRRVAAARKNLHKTLDDIIARYNEIVELTGLSPYSRFTDGVGRACRDQQLHLCNSGRP
jgi:hypothetical protein